MINSRSDKVKRHIFDIIWTLLVVPLFFLFYINDGHSYLHYEFAVIAVFLALKDIRVIIFSKRHLIETIIFTFLLMVSSYKLWVCTWEVWLYLVEFALLTKGLFALWDYISQNKLSIDNEALINPVKSFILAFLSVCSSLLIVWSYSFYPALTSLDVDNQMDQIAGKIRFADVHAPLHTLFIKALHMIWNSHACVILVHIILISLLAGIFARYLNSKGVDIKWLVVIYVMISFSKASEILMYPWKDTPYTFILGIITYMIMRTLDDDYRQSVFKGILWGSLLVLCYLFRYNGIICTVFSAIFIICVCLKRHYINQLVSLVVTFVLLAAGSNWFIYSVMGCEHRENGFALAVFGSGIADVVYYDGNMTEEQLETADRILGVEWIKKNNEKWHSEALMWISETNDPEGFFKDPNNEVFNNFYVIGMGENKAELIKLYFQLFLKNPVICIKDIIYNTFSIWGYKYFICNFSIMVILASVIWYFRGRKHIRKNLLVLIPIVSNILSIAASSISNEVRYLLPSYILFTPLLFYFIAIGSRNENNLNESNPVENDQIKN